MINIKNVKKKYKNVQALNGISFNVKKGEIILILGPNGAGKTTLVKSILGFISIDEGSIICSDGIDIGYMQEEKFGKPDWSVIRLLKYVGELNGLKGEILKNKIDSLLKKFQLKKIENFMIKELSKGLRQRVKYAQITISDPDLFILDEPTSGLDPLGKVEMRNWIIEENTKGKTFMISSHLLDEVEKIGTRFVILVDGEIIDSGDISQFSSQGLEEYFVEIVKRGQDENSI